MVEKIGKKNWKMESLVDSIRIGRTSWEKISMEEKVNVEKKPDSEEKPKPKEIVKSVEEKLQQWS